MLTILEMVKLVKTETGLGLKESKKFCRNVVNSTFDELFKKFKCRKFCIET